MKTIGLTGGIGSGKSTIARILECLGYPVYVSDREASRLMNNHPGIRKEITEAFGHSLYDAEGQLSKPAMARLIFNDPGALKTVNRIVHPRVIEDFSNWCRQQHSELVFFESAILFEAGLNHYFDAVVCVTAPEELRLQRVMTRDRVPAEKVLERMRNQADEKEKCRQADYVIHNDTRGRVVRQVLEMCGGGKGLRS